MSLLKSLLAISIISASFPSFSAIPADTIIVDGTILTMDAKNRLLTMARLSSKAIKLLRLVALNLLKIIKHLMS